VRRVGSVFIVVEFFLLVMMYRMHREHVKITKEIAELQKRQLELNTKLTSSFVESAYIIANKRTEG
jgi:hypothetical protein